MKVAAELVPPPGAGLLTTMLNAAGCATISADRVAVNSVLLTRVAGKADPFTVSVDCGVKPDPITVSWVAPLKAKAVAGEMELMLGAGFTMVTDAVAD